MTKSMQLSINKMRLKLKKAPGLKFYDRLDPMPANNAQALEQIMLRYGEVATIPWLKKTYLVTSPEAMKVIFQTNIDNYQKLDPFYNRMRCLLGRGLITNIDHSWSSQRKLLQPLFHRHYLEKMVHVTADATKAMFDQWDKLANQGKSFNIAWEMRKLITFSSAKAMFSTDLSDNIEDILHIVQHGNQHIVNNLFTLLTPLIVPTPSNLKLRKGIKQLNAILQKIIDDRRNQLHGYDDLLTTLIKAQADPYRPTLSDQQIIDELKTFLVAGFETCSNLLSWVWYALAQNAHAKQQLTKEVRPIFAKNTPSFQDLFAMPYTEMVIHETLRLYPPNWTVLRLALQDDVLAGYHIPANTMIITAPYVMHRNPRYWENPHQFEPTRFTKENKAKRPKHAYSPFGYGPRVCIGSNFGILQSMVIVSMISARYDVTVQSEPAVEEQLYVNLQTKNGVFVKLMRIAN